MTRNIPLLCEEGNVHLREWSARVTPLAAECLLLARAGDLWEQPAA